MSKYKNEKTPRILELGLDGALTLKMSKMALNPFCDKTLQIYSALQSGGSVVR